MTCNCKKQYRCTECGNVQIQSSYCTGCCNTTLLPLTRNDNGIQTHAEYIEARAELDELRSIEEPTTSDANEKKHIASMIKL